MKQKKYSKCNVWHKPLNLFHAFNFVFNIDLHFKYYFSKTFFLKLNKNVKEVSFIVKSGKHLKALLSKVIL